MKTLTFRFATLAVLFLTLFGSASASADDMVTLLFNYSGVVNQEAVDGHAELRISQETGAFHATAWFQDFPSTFTPSAAGFSLISISCSNGSKNEGAANIITLSQGDYTSIRNVTVFDPSGEIVGDFLINGRFRKVDSNIFEADVLLSGYYHGPTDLEIISGYDLVTAPVEGQDDTLFGTTEIELRSTNGEVFRSHHSHTYRFEDGVTEPLTPNLMAVRYDASSLWRPDRSILTISGGSFMRAP